VYTVEEKAVGIYLKKAKFQTDRERVDVNFVIFCYVIYR